jgi:hypothetical protein
MVTSQPVHGISEYKIDHNHKRAVVPQHADDVVPQVQPTDNPYHWEVVVNHRDKIFSWVKASWSRTNEVMRRRTGAPLKRNSAVRRSDRKRVLITVGKTKLTMNTSATSDNLKMHRSFSFESEKYKESSVIVEEKQEEDKILETTVPINLGVGQNIGGRSTRFHEETYPERPVARTFAEILGEPFVPTAFFEGD